MRIFKEVEGYLSENMEKLEKLNKYISDEPFLEPTGLYTHLSIRFSVTFHLLLSRPGWRRSSRSVLFVGAKHLLSIGCYNTLNEPEFKKNQKTHCIQRNKIKIEFDISFNFCFIECKNK